MKLLIHIITIFIFIITLSILKTDSVQPLYYLHDLPYFAANYFKFFPSEAGASQFSNTGTIYSITKTIDNPFYNIAKSNIVLGSFQCLSDWSAAFNVTQTYQGNPVTSANVQITTYNNSIFSMFGFTILYLRFFTDSYISIQQQYYLTNPLNYSIVSYFDIVNTNIYIFVQSFQSNWIGPGPLMGQNLGFIFYTYKDNTTFQFAYDTKPNNSSTNVKVKVVLLAFNLVRAKQTAQLSNIDIMINLRMELTNYIEWKPAYFTYPQKNNMIFGLNDMEFTSAYRPYFKLTIDSVKGLIYQNNNQQSYTFNVIHLKISDKLCPPDHPYKKKGDKNCYSCEPSMQMTNTNAVFTQNKTTFTSSIYIKLNNSLSMYAYDNLTGIISKVCVHAQLCTSNYYLQIGKCINCSVSLQNCLECNSSSVCTNCLPGSFLDTSTCILCSSYIPQCNLCSSATICNGFQSMQILSKCLQCSNSSVCNVCQIGYYLDLNICYTCNTTIPGCTQCSLKNKCISCLSGTYISNYFCINCSSAIPECLTCDSGSICTSCSSSYYVDAGYCLSCNTRVPFCKECNLLNLCINCQSGYYYNSTSRNCEFSCVSISNCNICSSPVVCTNCAIGYFSNSGSCISCNLKIQNCIQCDSETQCKKCERGYFSQNNISCIACNQRLTGCTSCSSNSICSNCTNSYYLSNFVCKDCKNITENCQSCDTNSVCINCEVSYYKQGTKCQKCTNMALNCLQCSKEYGCTRCEDGYHIDSGVCKSCSGSINNCLSCNSSILCYSCISIDYEIKNGKCVHKCLSSLQGCTQCDSYDKCLSCNKDKYYKDNQTNRCQLCESIIQNCISCTIGNNNTYVNNNRLLTNESNKVNLSNKCEQCKKGYYLQQQMIECKDCGIAIQKCIQCVSSRECITCQKGYNIKDGQCIKDIPIILIIMGVIGLVVLLIIIILVINLIRILCCILPRQQQKLLTHQRYQINTQQIDQTFSSDMGILNISDNNSNITNTERPLIRQQSKSQQTLSKSSSKDTSQKPSSDSLDSKKDHINKDFHFHKQRG